MHPGSHIEAVYLCREPVDFRKSIDGLSALVQSQFGANPFGSSLHVFISRRRDRIKALYWHRNGFCLGTSVSSESGLPGRYRKTPTRWR